MQLFLKKGVVLLFLFSFFSFHVVGQSLIDTNRFTEGDISDSISPDLVDVLQNSPQLSQQQFQEINQAIDRIKTVMIDQYAGELIITSSPSSQQEKISNLLDSLSRSVCEQREKIIANHSFSDLYQPSQGGYLSGIADCYSANTLTHQEGIRYYTFADKGTMQVASLSLIHELGYSTTDIERYLKRDGIAYSAQSDQFFFDRNSSKYIVPLFNLSDALKTKKPWRGSFEAIKVVAYMTTDDYPFLNGELLVSIFAKKGDSLIKITTPYGKYQYTLLKDMMTMIKQLFVYSIEYGQRESITSSSVFHTIYTKNFADSFSSVQASLLENLVHYYLSILWQNDDNPEEFIRSVMKLTEKDYRLRQQLETGLADLEVFL